MTKTEEIDSYESVRIHHHKLHSKQIKGCSILKLQCDIEVFEGHDICAKYQEKTVADLLLHPAQLDDAAQEVL